VKVNLGPFLLRQRLHLDFFFGGVFLGRRGPRTGRLQDKIKKVKEDLSRYYLLLTDGVG